MPRNILSSFILIGQGRRRPGQEMAWQVPELAFFTSILMKKSLWIQGTRKVMREKQQASSYVWQVNNGWSVLHMRKKRLVK